LAPTDKHVATEDDGYVPIFFTDIVTLLEYRTQQVHDLFSVLQLFVLPQECMQCTFERRLANSYSACDNSTIPLPPYGNACDYCFGNIARHLPRVVHATLRKALVDIFLGPDSIDQPTLDDTFVAALHHYPNAQAAFFASKAQGKPSNKQIKTIVLMLLAAGIVTHKIAYVDTGTGESARRQPIVVARLALDTEHCPLVYDNAIWNRLPLRDGIQSSAT
jgi:hypothetical protein